MLDPPGTAAIFVYSFIFFLCPAKAHGTGLRLKGFQFAADVDTIVQVTNEDFSCEGRAYGYYADQTLECKVFHICSPVEDDAGHRVKTFMFSFFCPNKTIFSQDSRTCIDEKVALPCERAHTLYDRNEALGQDFSYLLQNQLLTRNFSGDLQINNVIPRGSRISSKSNLPSENFKIPSHQRQSLRDRQTSSQSSIDGKFSSVRENLKKIQGETLKLEDGLPIQGGLKFDENGDSFISNPPSFDKEYLPQVEAEKSSNRPSHDLNQQSNPNFVERRTIDIFPIRNEKFSRIRKNVTESLQKLLIEEQRTEEPSEVINVVPERDDTQVTDTLRQRNILGIIVENPLIDTKNKGVSQKISNEESDNFQQKRNKLDNSNFKDFSSGEHRWPNKQNLNLNTEITDSIPITSFIRNEDINKKNEPRNFGGVQISQKNKTSQGKQGIGHKEEKNTKLVFTSHDGHSGFHQTNIFHDNNPVVMNLSDKSVRNSFKPNKYVNFEPPEILMPPPPFENSFPEFSNDSNSRIETDLNIDHDNLNKKPIKIENIKFHIGKNFTDGINNDAGTSSRNALSDQALPDRTKEITVRGIAHEGENITKYKAGRSKSSPLSQIERTISSQRRRASKRKLSSESGNRQSISIHPNKEIDLYSQTTNGKNIDNLPTIKDPSKSTILRTSGRIATNSLPRNKFFSNNPTKINRKNNLAVVGNQSSSNKNKITPKKPRFLSYFKVESNFVKHQNEAGTSKRQVTLHTVKPDQLSQFKVTTINNERYLPEGSSRDEEDTASKQGGRAAKSRATHHRTTTSRRSQTFSTTPYTPTSTTPGPRVPRTFTVTTPRPVTSERGRKKFQPSQYILRSRAFTNNLGGHQPTSTRQLTSTPERSTINQSSRRTTSLNVKKNKQNDDANSQDDEKKRRNNIKETNLSPSIGSTRLRGNGQLAVLRVIPTTESTFKNLKNALSPNSESLPQDSQQTSFQSKIESKKESYTIDSINTATQLPNRVSPTNTSINPNNLVQNDKQDTSEKIPPGTNNSSHKSRIRPNQESHQITQRKDPDSDKEKNQPIHMDRGRVRVQGRSRKGTQISQNNTNISDLHTNEPTIQSKRKSANHARTEKNQTSLSRINHNIVSQTKPTVVSSTRREITIRTPVQTPNTEDKISNDEVPNSMNNKALKSKGRLSQNGHVVSNLTQPLQAKGEKSRKRVGRRRQTVVINSGDKAEIRNTQKTMNSLVVTANKSLPTVRGSRRHNSRNKYRKNSDPTRQVTIKLGEEIRNENTNSVQINRARSSFSDVEAQNQPLTVDKKTRRRKVGRHRQQSNRTKNTDEKMIEEEHKVLSSVVRGNKVRQSASRSRGSSRRKFEKNVESLNNQETIKERGAVRLESTKPKVIANKLAEDNGTTYVRINQTIPISSLKKGSVRGRLSDKIETKRVKVVVTRNNVTQTIEIDVPVDIILGEKGKKHIADSDLLNIQKSKVKHTREVKHPELPQRKARITKSLIETRSIFENGAHLNPVVDRTRESQGKTLASQENHTSLNNGSEPVRKAVSSEGSTKVNRARADYTTSKSFPESTKEETILSSDLGHQQVDLQVVSNFNNVSKHESSKLTQKQQEDEKFFSYTTMTQDSSLNHSVLSGSKKTSDHSSNQGTQIKRQIISLSNPSFSNNTRLKGNKIAKEVRDTEILGKSKSSEDIDFVNLSPSVKVHDGKKGGEKFTSKNQTVNRIEHGSKKNNNTLVTLVPTLMGLNNKKDNNLVETRTELVNKSDEHLSSRKNLNFSTQSRKIDDTFTKGVIRPNSKRNEYNSRNIKISQNSDRQVNSKITLTTRSTRHNNEKSSLRDNQQESENADESKTNFSINKKGFEKDQNQVPNNWGRVTARGRVISRSRSASASTTPQKRGNSRQRGKQETNKIVAPSFVQTKTFTNNSQIVSSISLSNANYPLNLKHGLPTRRRLTGGGRTHQRASKRRNKNDSRTSRTDILNRAAKPISKEIYLAKPEDNSTTSNTFESKPRPSKQTNNTHSLVEGLSENSQYSGSVPILDVKLNETNFIQSGINNETVQQAVKHGKNIQVDSDNRHNLDASKKTTSDSDFTIIEKKFPNEAADTSFGQNIAHPKKELPGKNGDQIDSNKRNPPDVANKTRFITTQQNVADNKEKVLDVRTSQRDLSRSQRARQPQRSNDNSGKSERIIVDKNQPRANYISTSSTKGNYRGRGVSSRGRGRQTSISLLPTEVLNQTKNALNAKSKRLKIPKRRQTSIQQATTQQRKSLNVKQNEHAKAFEKVEIRDKNMQSLDKDTLLTAISGTNTSEKSGHSSNTSRKRLISRVRGHKISPSVDAKKIKSETTQTSKTIKAITTSQKASSHISGNMKQTELHNKSSKMIRKKEENNQQPKNVELGQSKNEKSLVPSRRKVRRNRLNKSPRLFGTKSATKNNESPSHNSQSQPVRNSHQKKSNSSNMKIDLNKSSDPIRRLSSRNLRLQKQLSLSAPSVSKTVDMNIENHAKASTKEASSTLDRAVSPIPAKRLNESVIKPSSLSIRRRNNVASKSLVKNSKNIKEPEYLLQSNTSLPQNSQTKQSSASGLLERSQLLSRKRFLGRRVTERQNIRNSQLHSTNQTMETTKDNEIKRVSSNESPIESTAITSPSRLRGRGRPKNLRRGGIRNANGTEKDSHTGPKTENVSNSSFQEKTSRTTKPTSLLSRRRKIVPKSKNVDMVRSDGINQSVPPEKVSIQSQISEDTSPHDPSIPKRLLSRKRPSRKRISPNNSDNRTVVGNRDTLTELENALHSTTNSSDNDNIKAIVRNQSISDNSSNKLSLSRRKPVGRVNNAVTTGPSSFSKIDEKKKLPSIKNRNNLSSGMIKEGDNEIDLEHDPAVNNNFGVRMKTTNIHNDSNLTSSRNQNLISTRNIRLSARQNNRNQGLSSKGENEKESPINNTQDDSYNFEFNVKSRYNDSNKQPSSTEFSEYELSQVKDVTKENHKGTRRRTQIKTNAKYRSAPEKQTKLKAKNIALRGRRVEYKPLNGHAENLTTTHYIEDGAKLDEMNDNKTHSWPFVSNSGTGNSKSTLSKHEILPIKAEKEELSEKKEDISIRRLASIDSVLEIISQTTPRSSTKREKEDKPLENDFLLNNHEFIPPIDKIQPSEIKLSLTNNELSQKSKSNTSFDFILGPLSTTTEKSHITEINKTSPIIKIKPPTLFDIFTTPAIKTHTTPIPLEVEESVRQNKEKRTLIYPSKSSKTSNGGLDGLLNAFPHLRKPQTSNFGLSSQSQSEKFLVGFSNQQKHQDKIANSLPSYETDLERSNIYSPLPFKIKAHSDENSEDIFPDKHSLELLNYSEEEIDIDINEDKDEGVLARLFPFHRNKETLEKETFTSSQVDVYPRNIPVIKQLPYSEESKLRLIGTSIKSSVSISREGQETPVKDFPLLKKEALSSEEKYPLSDLELHALRNLASTI